MQSKNSNRTTAAVRVLPLRERAAFFTRADNDLFQYLITKYKDILFENKTDNYTKRLKQGAWLAILDEFNMAAEEPRTLRKLKFKFHNTKTKARKSVNDNGGKKPFLTNSNDIKWMQSIMAVSMINQNNVDEDFCIDHNKDEELGRTQIEIVQYKPMETNDMIEVPASPVTHNEVTNVKHIEMDVEVDVKETIVPEKDSLSLRRSSLSEENIKLLPKKAETLKEPILYSMLKKAEPSKDPLLNSVSKKAEIFKGPVLNAVPKKAEIKGPVSNSVQKKAEARKDPVLNSLPKKTELFKTPVKVSAGNHLLNIVKPKKLTNYDKKIYKLHAKHMQEQRNEEHELFQLKKKKLLMEINLLVKSK